MAVGIGTSLASAFVDVLPTPGSFSKGLVDEVQKGGDEAARHTEAAGERIGGVFHNIAGQLGGEVGEVFDKIGDGVEKVTKHVGQLGGALTAGGGIIAGLGLLLRQSGSADKQATDQLRQAIKNTGGSWGDYKDQVEEAVKTGERYAHRAPDTMAALQAITQATNDPQKAFKNLALVEDLAASKHESLAAAGEQIALVYAGNTRLLRQYGITTTDVDVALSQLAAKLNGQAAASVDNFSGHINAFRAHAEDVVATLGQKLGPAVTYVGSALGIAGSAIEVFGAIEEKASASGVSMRQMLSGMIGPTLAVTATVTAATGILIAMGRTAKDNAARIRDLTQAVKDDNGSIGDNTRNKVANNLASHGALDLAKQLGLTLSDITDYVLAPNSLGWQRVNAALNVHSEAAGRVASVSRAGTVGINQQTTAVGKLKFQLDQQAGATQNAVDANHLLKESTDLAHSSTSNLFDYMYSKDPFTDTAVHVVKLSHRLVDLKSDTDRVSTAWAVMTGTLSATQAEEAAKDAIFDISKALKAKKASLDEDSHAGRQNRELVLQAISSFQDQAQQLQKLGHSNEYVQGTYKSHLTALRNTTKAGTPLRAEIDKIIAKFKHIPRGITTTIEIEAYLKSLPTHSSMAPGEAGFGSTRSNDSPGPKPKRRPRSKSSTGRAAGGPVFAGVEYEVGEAGGEGFVAPADGYIIPHAASMGRSITIQQTISGGDTDIAAQHRRAADAAWTEILRIEQAG